jgi:hypothetical protein
MFSAVVGAGENSFVVFKQGAFGVVALELF